MAYQYLGKKFGINLTYLALFYIFVGKSKLKTENLCKAKLENTISYVYPWITTIIII